MALKKFSTEQQYSDAGLPTTESRVAYISESKRVAYDGINVRTDNPMMGDAAFLVTENDTEKVIILKGGAQLKSALLPANYQYIGPVMERTGANEVRVIWGNGFGSVKYADVVQFQLNAPTIDGAEHTATIGLRLNGGTAAGWDKNTTISYTYAATTLAGVCDALNAAIDARQAELGFTQTLWAYMANDDNEKVTDAAQATKIIVQLDTWSDYRQYNCSGMTHITWGDMPARDWYMKVNGKTTNYRGLLNIARGHAYWATNGRTPTANVAVGSEAGNTDPVKLAVFTDSEYCAELRTHYGDYDSYLRGEFSIVFPQKWGCFGLPDGATLTQKYGNCYAPTKAGDEKYKYPALHWPFGIGIGSGEAAIGEWHLWDVREGTIFMRDDNLRLINATQSKMGKTQISNATSRWFAERYNVGYAWFFYGYYGHLYITYVDITYQVGAVTLLHFE